MLRTNHILYMARLMILIHSDFKFVPAIQLYIVINLFKINCGYKTNFRDKF